MHAGGARSNHAFHQLECIKVAAETSFGVCDDRREPVDAVVAVQRVDLIGAEERIIDALDHLRNGIHRVQALVRVHLTGAVAVTGDLPAGAIDGLEARLNFLNCLVAGQCAERTERIFLVDKAPEFLAAQACQRMLHLHGAAQFHDVFSTVIARDALPARAIRPVGIQFFDLLLSCHDDHLASCPI